MTVKNYDKWDRERLIAEIEKLERQVANLDAANTRLQAPRLVQEVVTGGGNEFEQRLNHMASDYIGVKKQLSTTLENQQLFFNRGEDTYDNIDLEYAEISQKLGEAEVRQDILLVVEILADIANVLEQNALDIHGELKDAIPQGRLTIDQWTAAIFSQSALMYMNIGQRIVAMELMTAALAMTGHPALLCSRIWIELQTKGDISMRALAALDPQWIATHIPEAPGELHTLKNGLEWAWKRLTSGKSRAAFCKTAGYEPRTMKRYEDWYKAVEQESRSASEEMRLMIRNKVEAAASAAHERLKSISDMAA